MPSQCQHRCVPLLIKRASLFLPLVALRRAAKSRDGETLPSVSSHLCISVCVRVRMHTCCHTAFKRLSHIKKKESIRIFCDQLLYPDRKTANKRLKRRFSHFTRTITSVPLFTPNFTPCVFRVHSLVCRQSKNLYQWVSFFFFGCPHLLYIPFLSIIKEKNYFAQKSQLRAIKYGSSGTEARARTRPPLAFFFFLMCRQNHPLIPFTRINHSHK